jgi:hypothetical protein
MPMRFSDFFNPERGPVTISRLAIYGLVFAATGRAVASILIRLAPANTLLPLLVLSFVSPLAYLIREARRTRQARWRPRRGAERTPLLPPHEEVL